MIVLRLRWDCLLRVVIRAWEGAVNDRCIELVYVVHVRLSLLNVLILRIGVEMSRMLKKFAR